MVYEDTSFLQRLGTCTLLRDGWAKVIPVFRQDYLGGMHKGDRTTEDLVCERV